MKLNVFTQYWGDVYRAYYKNYCLPSIQADVQALRDDGWEVEVIALDRQGNITQGIGEFIGKCIAEQAIGVLAMPDFFFGPGTIVNGVRIIEGKKDVCLAVPHARVKATRAPGLNTNMSNSQLVEFALANPHWCLDKAFDYTDINLTWAGISARWINQKMVAVIHNMADPLIMQFTQGDAEFFKNNPLTAWDRSFAKKLLNEKRLRICGSSDACYFLEVTDDNNNPALRPGMKNNDRSIDEAENFIEVVNIWRLP